MLLASQEQVLERLPHLAFRCLRLLSLGKAYRPSFLPRQGNFAFKFTICLRLLEDMSILKLLRFLAWWALALKLTAFAMLRLWLELLGESLITLNEGH